MTARACGISSPTAFLNPVKPPRRRHLNLLTPVLVALGEPGPEGLPGPARDHTQQASRSRPVAHGGQVNDHGDIAVTTPGVVPHVLVSSKNLHPLESVGRLVEDLLGQGQYCVVGGMPEDPQGGCYPGDRHALQGKGTHPPLHR